VELALADEVRQRFAVGAAGKQFLQRRGVAIAQRRVLVRDDPGARLLELVRQQQLRVESVDRCRPPPR
jgi:hypothetical protein